MRNRSGFVVLGTLLLSLSAAADDTADVLQTDREFAAHSREHGPVAAFDHYMAHEATWLPVGAAPVQGRTAIIEAMSEGPAYQLDWSPAAGEASGDMAYTWGTYTVRFTDPERGDITGYGKYLTVWKRQADGNWRWTVDMGNPSPPPDQAADRD